MKLFKTLAAIGFVAIFATGCASVSTDKWQNCALAGAALGGAAGGFGDDHDSEDAVLSAIGGAVIGGTICALMADDEPVPVPVVEEPVLDSDGDGVIDSLDQCPNTPAGASVDSKGCALDSDGDGVADYKDQCPNSAPGAKVNELGCAAAFVLHGVNFHTNSADLTDEAKAILQPIAISHHTHHGDINLVISGHTDSTGAAAYNKQLSQSRADSVRAYMISEGCAADKLTAMGYGEENPIADNATKAGRAENRRVELSVK